MIDAIIVLYVLGIALAFLNIGKYLKHGDVSANFINTAYFVVAPIAIMATLMGLLAIALSWVVYKISTYLPE